jgi:hypothetical protein
MGRTGVGVDEGVVLIMVICFYWMVFFNTETRR